MVKDSTVIIRIFTTSVKSRTIHLQIMITHAPGCLFMAHTGTPAQDTLKEYNVPENDWILTHLNNL